MKIKLVLATILGVLMLGGTAEASFFLRYPPIKQATDQFARQLCNETQGCVRWGDSCRRASPKRIDCVVENKIREEEPERTVELTCQLTLHWLATGRGQLKLRHGPPHCSEA